MGTPSKAKPKKVKDTSSIRATTNPCNDQNGVVLCWGGHQTNFPFPASGGPFAMVVAYNATTGLMELQYADLATLCPGTFAGVAETPKVGPKPCEGCP